jgi:hypothetical protein
MGQAAREGLSAAADALARIMRLIAAEKTLTTAAAVNSYLRSDDESVVAAGYPTGRWGWEPIQALMFDDDKKHPLFGNEKHWYHQGYYSITEATVELGGDEAAEAFADAYVDLFLAEHGFK